MLWRRGLAVHLVRQEHVRPHGFEDREAALVTLLLLVLDAPVEPCEGDLDRAVADARLLEQGPKRRPPPACGPDRLQEPRLAHRPGLEQRPAVSGALEGHRELRRRPGPDVVERERELPL